MTHSPQTLFTSRSFVDAKWPTPSDAYSPWSTSANLQNKTFTESFRKTGRLSVSTLFCQGPLIRLWCIHSASAASKALCMQKLMLSATAAISRQGERIDHPSLWVSSGLASWHTYHVSLRHSTLHHLFPHLPPCFLYLFFGRRIHSILGSQAHAWMCTQPFWKKSSIFIYWSQAGTEAKIMTDNHVVFVIYGKMMGEELIQLPFPKLVSG